MLAGKILGHPLLIVKGRKVNIGLQTAKRALVLGLAAAGGGLVVLLIGVLTQMAFLTTLGGVATAFGLICAVLGALVVAMRRRATGRK